MPWGFSSLIEDRYGSSPSSSEQNWNALSSVLSALDLPNNVVALAEEGKPFIQYSLLLVLQVVPFRYTIFGLQGGACEGTGGVLAGEYYISQNGMSALLPLPRRKAGPSLQAGRWLVCEYLPRYEPVAP